MDTISKLKRLNQLKAQHAHQHSIVEALEAEKAPEDAIKQAKILKLNMKDEIFSLENELKTEGITC